MATLTAWFAEKIPSGWFDAVEVVSDRDEILVVGTLPDDVSPKRFRERTRDDRVAIARVAEAAFDRTVTWAVRSGGETVRFTTVTVPVMTRLRVEERLVLDQLIDGGIARSRSEALAWCVRLVGANEQQWLSELREASARLADVRRRGPAC